MKYILYITAYLFTLIGGGAWFFYNYRIGLLGVLLAWFIIYRQERQPRPLVLSLDTAANQRQRISADAMQDFDKAVSDFNALEASRRSVAEPALKETLRRMQHIARNFLYYLQAYPERIPLANRFINYYQEQAVKMVGQYKNLAVTGLKTAKVVDTQKKLRRLIGQLEQAYAEQFTQTLAVELTDLQGLNQEMQDNLERDGIFGGAAAPMRRRKKGRKLKKWRQKMAARFDYLLDGYVSSLAPELHHNINEERLLAAVLAFFLGFLGIQKFYLGKTKQGILCILFCWTFVPVFLGFVEGIRYLCMSSDEFYYTCYRPKYSLV